MPHTRESFEVVILGGGPAGLAAGLHLATVGRDVIVINRPLPEGRLPRPKIGECLAPTSLPILQRLGIHDLVAAPRHLPSPGNLSSWGHEDLAALDFIHHPYGHGWHLDRAAFEEDLKARAVASGCPILEANLRRATHDEHGGWTFERDVPPNRIKALHAIDASGRASFLAHALGARKTRHDQLVAVYAFLEPGAQPIPDATALVEARPDGWWYSARIPDGRLSVAYMTDPDLLQASGGSTEAAWTRFLGETNHTRQRVSRGTYRLVDEPRVAPAGSAILDRLSGANWIACGDAAASYDPLSSHGIATALASGRDAAEALQALLCGDPEPRARYEDRVRRSFEYYLQMRTEYYTQETRWRDRPFWQRRNRG